MNNIMAQAFSFQAQKIRTITEDGKIWFVGIDIAKLLGYARPDKEVKRVCKHVKLFIPTKLVGRGLGVAPRGLLVIPEADVWRLIVRSTLPKAQKVEEWIMGEVLPSIRKTGKYEAAPKQLSLPEPQKEKPQRSMLEIDIDIFMKEIALYAHRINENIRRLDDTVLRHLREKHGWAENPKADALLQVRCAHAALWTSIDYSIKAAQESVKVTLEYVN
ncbi:MAG: hypothetical protein LBV80_07990 [Deltaproteobacteria bacterium]|jgi:prophage antirepressor-like protein|nr:hypothetical protein [Deltaproteobacteria bacterium]